MDGRKKYRARRAIAAVMAALMLCALFAGCEKRQIVAGVPGDGKQITTANAVVAEFCRDYKPGTSEDLREYSDMYYPAGVDLEWSYATADSPLYAFVVVSRHKDPRAALAKYPVGGLFYDATNMESQEQLREMLETSQSFVSIPMLFACDEEGGIVFLGLLGQFLRGISLTQDIFQLDTIQQMRHAGVATFDFSPDGGLVFLFFFHIDQPDVTLPAVGNVDGEVDSIGRTRRKIETNNNFVHSVCALF